MIWLAWSLTVAATISAIGAAVHAVRLKTERDQAITEWHAAVDDAARAIRIAVRYRQAARGLE